MSAISDTKIPDMTGKPVDALILPPPAMLLGSSICGTVGKGIDGKEDNPKVFHGAPAGIKIVGRSLQEEKVSLFPRLGAAPRA
ncbi:hypothetical protein B9Z19DRAFT_1127280 [Tuber borchii]|uniref:Uncharacterized protein n=1 Tax=Tuber borchii TaxID=42251 RepID=A0A2T6ZRQ7_TUBBO|nr:hypothetical protein B9Z19DRAFT_1127280 [Tuber borchii]